VSTAKPSFICIIKAGSTVGDIASMQGDFEDWIRDGLLPGLSEAEGRPSIQVIDVNNGHTPGALPDIAGCAGIVISGSHAMVTDAEPWMVELEGWLRDACLSGVPVLGICFGHQLLAHALGGQVGPHPGGLELGTVPVSIKADVSGDPLWQEMPGSFDANVVHYQTVLRLPAQAIALAGNSHEPHHAFRWRSSVWGVQFHPEFSVHAMQACVDHVLEGGARRGQGIPDIHSIQCRETTAAAGILANFARHVQALACLPDAWGRAA